MSLQHVYREKRTAAAAAVRQVRNGDFVIVYAMGTITAIDLALSTLILLILLGLAVRAALHFHGRSELPWSRPRS